MEPILAYTGFLKIDTDSLIPAGIMLFVMISGLSAWYIIKKLSGKHNIKMHETEFGAFLFRFSNFCEMHYRSATMKLHGYTAKKGNEFDGKSITSDGRQKIVTIDPESLFKKHQVLLSGDHAARVSTVLIDSLYQLRSCNHEMDHFLSSFTTTYQEALKVYYGNIYELGLLNDELKKYAKGKSLNKAAGEWMNDFFGIFEQWIRNGKSSDMMVLQREIVQKVMRLNKLNTVSPFSNRSNEKAIRCEQAFQKITELDDSLKKQLGQYIWEYKRAAKISWLIGKSIVPLSHREAILNHNEPVVLVRQRGMKEKVAIGLGFLAIGAISFFGGTYFNGLSTRGSDKRIISYNRNISAAGIDVKSHPLPAAADSTVISGFDSVPIVYGLDIAKYQGDLLHNIDNFDTLHFIICKATEGISLVDAEFEYNWKTLKDLSIIRGAYHFYKAKDDPVRQAQHFLRIVDTLMDKDIPLVLDIEEQSVNNSTKKADLQSGLLIFLAYIEKQTGRKPIIYTDLNFANTYLQWEAFADYPLWLAEYSRRPTPIIPHTWKHTGIKFWQKTDTLKVDSRRTDLDVFRGDGAEFKAFIKKKGPG